MIIRILLYVYLFKLCSSFTLTNKNHVRYSYQTYMWESLDKNIKEAARKWFIHRAENAGIHWNSMVKDNEKKMESLKNIFDAVQDKHIEYPDYYTKPFHGYDDGNLNWKAALEGEAATLSMAVNYWKNNDPLVTEKWLRYNVTKNIKKYYNKYYIESGKDILDIGCSVGISTEYLHKSFPNAKSVSGIDLSPFYLSIAISRATESDLPIRYFHKLAENTGLKTDSFDLIVSSFMFHEIPEKSSQIIMNEIHRILKPGGVFAIIDLDPTNLHDKLVVSTFRKWAFDATEPHIKNYYDCDLTNLMKTSEFIHVEKMKNDPINSLWIGRKDKHLPDFNKKLKNELKTNKKDKNKNDDGPEIPKAKNMYIVPPFTIELADA